MRRDGDDLVGPEAEHVLVRRDARVPPRRDRPRAGCGARGRGRRRRAGGRACPSPGRRPTRPRPRSRGPWRSRTLPCPSSRPRRSSSGASPATPIAWSVWPVRHGAAHRVGDDDRHVDPGEGRAAGTAARGPTRPGRRAAAAPCPCSVPLASTPAAASTRPCRVSTIRVGPRRATTRTVSAVIASSRSTRTARPSALDTTFDVTTTTSPSASAKSSAASAAVSNVARSSPAATSGTPSGAQTSSEPLTATRAGRAPRLRAPGPSAPWPRPTVDVGHQQRYGAAGDAGAPRPTRPASASVCVDQPAVEQAAVAPAAVVQRDGLGRGLDADRGEHPVGHAAHRSAADDRRQADHGCRRRRPAPRACPGTDSTVPMLTTGLDGGSSTRSAVANASSTPGPGVAVVGADGHDLVRLRLGVQPHPVLLEVHRAPSAGGGVVVDDDVGLDPVVAHRQQRHAEVGETPATAQGRGDLAQRVARVEHLGADDVGGDVAVTEAEPGRLHAVGRELLLDHEASRRRGPSPGPRGCRRRGCTSRCRGRGRPAARTA